MKELSACDSPVHYALGNTGSRVTNTISNTKNLCGYPSEARNHCPESLLVISGPRNISFK